MRQFLFDEGENDRVWRDLPPNAGAQWSFLRVGGYDKETTESIATS